MFTCNDVSIELRYPDGKSDKIPPSHIAFVTVEIYKDSPSEMPDYFIHKLSGGQLGKQCSLVIEMKETKKYIQYKPTAPYTVTRQLIIE